MGRKAICCVLIAAALCLGTATAFAEVFLIEEPLIEPVLLEEAPAAQEEIYPQDMPGFEDESCDEEPKAAEEASFTFHTPEDMSIVFGAETQSIGFVSVSEATGLREGQRIVLYIESPAFVNLDSPDETIPLSITDAEGNNVICLWDETMGERTVELFIHISAEDWARAALGRYAATIDYRAAVK